jgi:hypothetical protein
MKNTISTNRHSRELSRTQRINVRWILEDLRDKGDIDDRQYKAYCERHKVKYIG